MKHHPLHAVARYTLLVLALVPLIVDKSVFFPYITGKSMLIRVIIMVVWALLASGLIVSDRFRATIKKRMAKIVRSPVFWGLTVFSAIVVISSALAKPSFSAIFGDIERAEGMLGLLYYISIGVLAMLFFGEGDWKWFFRSSMGVGIVLFIHALIQWSGGMARPASFLGNPIYLAVFFLFTFFAGWWDAICKKCNKWWRIAGVAMMVISVFGVFLTETRGVVAGMLAGAVVVGVWASLRGGDKRLTSFWTVRKVAVALLIFIIAGSGFFIATRHSSLWQKIPGFDRLSQFSLNDATLQTRLISLGISWHAIHPSREGWKKFIIGWGSENFSIAYNKYYNPEFYQYEASWFDRAHDKLMDVMVMHGMAGLLSYLFLWVALWWAITKRRGKKEIGHEAALLFFVVAYFVQNLFVFDAVATYVIFFMFIAFVAWRQSILKRGEEEESDHKEPSLKGAGVYGGVAGVMALAAMIGFFGYTLPGYLQMTEYISLVKQGSLQGVLNKMDGFLSPFTVAQENIRSNMLPLATNQAIKNPTSKDANTFVQKTLDAMNNLIKKEPYEPRYAIQMAQFYGSIGDAEVNAGRSGQSFYQKTIPYLHDALAVAPGRQEIMYVLAYNQAKLGKLDDAVDTLSKTADDDPLIGDTYYYWGMIEMSGGASYYNHAFDTLEKAYNAPYFRKRNENANITVSAYVRMLEHFKTTRDTERFIGCAQRLMRISTGKEATLTDAIKSAKNGEWETINFNLVAPSPSATQ